MAGGPPVRGEMLPIWEPEAPLDAERRHAWGLAAQRVASGLRELAHLPVTADDEQAIIAFPEPEGVAAAAEWVQAIRSENVDARLLLDGTGNAGVQLPCRSDFSDEEIRHVVLACVKAAHVGLGVRCRWQPPRNWTLSSRPSASSAMSRRACAHSGLAHGCAWCGGNRLPAGHELNHPAPDVPLGKWVRDGMAGMRTGGTSCRQ